jgi:hypothetical protein
MHVTFKTVIEAGLMSLVLAGCATAGNPGGDANAAGGNTGVAPAASDATRCEETPGSTTPSDCQLIQGSGQMTPGNRK